MANLITVAKPRSNSLAGTEEERRQRRAAVQRDRKQGRKIESSRLCALVAFANLGEKPQKLQTFRRMHPDFEPFQIVDTKNKGVRVMAPRFHSMVLAWRDLLRCVWQGKAQTWELETLLGLNPDGASGPWGGDAPFVKLWNSGLQTAQIAGFHFPRYPPLIRSHWNNDNFSYEAAGAFQKAVYSLWRKRWRARVCRMCGSYFIAQKVAQKYCSKHCFQEGKNKRSREWWKASGPDWRKRFLAERAKAERRSRRKKGAK